MKLANTALDGVSLIVTAIDYVLRIVVVIAIMLLVKLIDLLIDSLRFVGYWLSRLALHTLPRCDHEVCRERWEGRDAG